MRLRMISTKSSYDRIINWNIHNVKSFFMYVQVHSGLRHPRVSTKGVVSILSSNSIKKITTPMKDMK